MPRTLTDAEKAVAGYQWLTTADLQFEMKTSRQTVINIITSPEFGEGNVTRWGREYRIRPEAWTAYKARNVVSTREEEDAA